MTRRLATVLALVLTLAGCTVKEDPPSTPGTNEITFLVFETTNLTPAYWDAAIKRVTDKHPDIKVKKIVSPDQDRTTYAKQLLTAGNLPDVMIAVSPAGFAEAGHLAEWSPADLKDFNYPTNGAVKGKVYQLPTNTQTIPIVYYNKDMFTAAGITAAPKSYAELLDASAKLKAKGVQPFTIGGTHDNLGPTFAGILGTDLYAKNPNWMADRRADKVKFCDAEFKGAAAKLADLAAKGFVNKTDMSRDYGQGEAAFLGGKGAMYPMGNWFTAALDDPAKKPKFEVGQFFWPSDTGKLAVPAFTGGGMLVAAKSKSLDAAKKFAVEFTLNPENLATSAVGDGLFIAVKGWQVPATAGPAYKEAFKQYSEGLAAGAVVPSFGFEAGDAAMLPGMVKKWDSSGVDLVTGKKNADQVCAYLDAEWAKEAQ